MRLTLTVTYPAICPEGQAVAARCSLVVDMTTTSESLLRRLKTPEETSAWHRFVDIYGPLIFYWARQTGLDDADASDLVQDVFVAVFQHIHRYQTSKATHAGSFRAWLRTITINRRRQLARRAHRRGTTQQLGGMEELPDRRTLESSWDSSYPTELIRIAMQSMKKMFAPPTWSALMEWLKSGEAAREVAARHGISQWTLYAAKKRLILHLRQELDGLLD